MVNLEQYTQAFVDTFGVTAQQTKGLKYQDVEAWDSVGHMQLVTALEDAFDIMMETEDIIDLSSFEKGMEILAKYDVEIG